MGKVVIPTTVLSYIDESVGSASLKETVEVEKTLEAYA
jgi:3-dehydroquinate synthetase